MQEGPQQGDDSLSSKRCEMETSPLWGDRVEAEEDGPEPITNIERGTVQSNYSGKFQVLQQDISEDDGSERNTSEGYSSEEELEVKPVDWEKIYWIPEDNAYAHSSGVRYEVNTKEYTSWVTDDPEDLRCLYYLPFQGVIKLVRSGKRCKINNRVLKDMDWDRSRIYNEKSIGYREDLHKLFRDKIDSINRSSEV